MLALSGEREAGADILRLQFRLVSKYFGLRPTGREPIQDIVNRDAQAAHAGFATAFAGLHRNPIKSAHWVSTVLRNLYIDILPRRQRNCYRPHVTIWWQIDPAQG